MNSRERTGIEPARSSGCCTSMCTSSAMAAATSSCRFPRRVEKLRSPSSVMPGTSASWNGVSSPRGETPSFAICSSSPAGSRADEDILEELTRAAPCTPVDVAGQLLLEAETRLLEDLRVQLFRVVPDDDHRGARRELPVRVSEHGHHVVYVSADGLARMTARRRTDLFLPTILQTEQLVRIPVLLVVIDETGIWR